MASGSFDVSAALMQRITYNLEISQQNVVAPPAKLVLRPPAKEAVRADSLDGGVLEASESEPEAMKRPSLRKKPAGHEQEEEAVEEKEDDWKEVAEQVQENEGEEARDAKKKKKKSAGAGQVSKKPAAKTVATKRPAADMLQLEADDEAGYEDDDDLPLDEKANDDPGDKDKANDEGDEDANDSIMKKPTKADDEGDENDDDSVVQIPSAPGGKLIEVGPEWWVLVTKRTGGNSIGQKVYAYIHRAAPNAKIYNLGAAMNDGFPCSQWVDLKREGKHEF